MSKPIVIIGSTHIEIMLMVDQLPAAGEVAHRAAVHTAGAPASRLAAAAVRAGGSVIFAGRVGDDLFGVVIRDELRSQGVNVDLLKELPGTASGTICTLTAKNGEQMQVIAHGANVALSAEEIETLRDVMRDAGLVMVEAGILLETVEQAVSLAFHQGKKVLLRLPAGSQIGEPSLRYLHTLVIDEAQAAVLANQPLAGVEDARRAARALAARGPLYVVIVMGGLGVVAAGPGLEGDGLIECQWSAAGSAIVSDTLCGRLAAALADGVSMPAALRSACQAVDAG